jgi:DNA-binding transcriptional LysR family regulator
VFGNFIGARVNIESLRRFIAVADEGSIGGAASELGLSQPVLSRQIGRLESELQFKLFRRVPGGVQLTAAGELFYQQAAESVRLIDAGINSARVLSASRPQLRIGRPSTPIIYEAIIQKFRTTYPNVDVIERVNRDGFPGD